MNNVMILPPDPGKEKENPLPLIVLDPGQVLAALKLLVFELSFPPEGNRAKRKARDRELVRRAAKVLLAKKEDPLVTRVMGRR